MIRYLTWDGRLVLTRARGACIGQVHHESIMVGPFPLAQYVCQLDSGPRFAATRMIDAVDQARSHLREHQS